ncbi:MAG: glutamate mutase L [Candidatus Izimaplasma sp.]|nr:glutamate mutase L [Candidatus Izimaplasma bacterium]
MTIDVLVAEIGSTTTIVNAFNVHSDIAFLGRGVASTTVDTDVNEGLNLAIDDLKQQLGVNNLTYDEMFASSSAAGGLKVSVHGLVYEMTVRASKEAALNAGANIHYITAGKLRPSDLDNIQKLSPNMIIIAGGTDYGERDTAIENTKQLLTLNLDVPMIYAGNLENQDIIRTLFQNADKSHLLKVVENVYPRVDQLNILPLRKVIYQTFEEHIIHAKGMGHIKALVNGQIMPTPGSVMESSMLLREAIGNLITIDVGGATTDIHSIANPSDEFLLYVEGEPLSKRTVEGDLGVFINHKNVLKTIGEDTLKESLNLTDSDYKHLIDQYTYIPQTKQQKQLVYTLTKHCVEHALNRHVGDKKKVYTSSGQKIIPEGKDLTQVTNIILTGGALVHLDNTEQIILNYMKTHPSKLLPSHVKIYKDENYIMASLGVLSLKYEEAALTLLKKSLKVK